MLLSRQECLATSTVSTLTPTRTSRRQLAAPMQDLQIAKMKQQEVVVVEGELVVELLLEVGLVIVVVGVGGVVG